MKIYTRLLAILLTLAGPTLGSAQSGERVYTTMKGQLIVTGQVGDSTVMLKSNRLLITLDYETADLVIRLNRKTLRGENESIPPADASVNEVLFEGKLGLDHVITHDHPPLNFEVEGHLFHGDQKTLITGQGRLEHIHADRYACLLDMEFTLPPSLLDIDWPGNEMVRVKIIQTILE